jgi:hypothetical protein
MAFDLQVFNKQTYTAMTETVAQDIEKFNEASAGTIILQNTPAQGDFDIRASFKAISGLVRRRNVYGDSTLEAKRLEHLLDISVKVAAGTPPINWENAQYNWIMQNPELAAITIGEQLAKARLADMLNTAVLAGTTAIGGNNAVVHDDAKNVPSFRTLNAGAAKFGDRSGAIKAWIVHSTTMHALFDNALTNGERLFAYDNVNVIRDPFGRLFVVTDSPALVKTGATPLYNTLGLVENAIIVNGNDDFDSVIQRSTGKENLQSTFQAEWSYNVGVLGYKWNADTANKSPDDVKLGTAANWLKSATFDKDTAGVLIKTK